MGKVNPTAWVRVPMGGTQADPSVYTAIREALQEVSDSSKDLQAQIERLKTGVSTGTSVINQTIISDGGGGGGGSGSVTSVDLTAPSEFSVSGNPVTIAGTLALSWVNQTANKVFASPNGSTGTPTFRALAAADIPDISATYLTVSTAASTYVALAGSYSNPSWITSLAGSKITGNISGNAANVTGVVAIANGGTNLSALGTANQVLGVNNGATGLEYKTVSAGTGISVTHAANSITVANTGVTSVGATSPVASSGGATPTISLSSGYGDTLNPYASKTANTVLAAPDGSSGAPSFRALVATDIPNLDAGKITTGTVSLARGGTNASLTAVNGGVVYSSSTALAITTAADMTWDNTNKRLGIGNASPATVLDIVHTDTTSTAINFTNSSTNAAANARFILNNSATSGGLQLRSTGHATEASDILFYSSANSLRFYTSGNNRLMVLSTGNTVVGSGEATTTPVGQTLRAPSGSGTDIAGGSLTVAAGNSTGTGAGGALIFQTAAAGAVSGTTANTLTERMRIASNGDVGIGTGGTPSYAFDFRKNTAGVATFGLTNTDVGAASDIRISLFNGTGNGGLIHRSSGHASEPNDILFYSASHNLRLYTSGNLRLSVLSGGNVGIGTASPSYPLHVASTITSTTGTYLSYSAATVTPSASANASYIGRYSLIVDTGANVTGASSALTSVYGEAYHNGSSTLTWLRGISAAVGTNGTGAITTAAAFYAFSPTQLSTGAYTTAYAAYLGAQKVTGVTTGYGLYSAGASDLNVMVGKLRVGSTSDPTNALDVTGTATISTKLLVGTTTADVNSLILSRSDTNGFTGITAYNQDAASTGAAAYISASDGTNGTSLYALGAAYTTAGGLQQNSSVLYAGKANGLNIIANNSTTGLVRVYAGGSAAANERARVALAKTLTNNTATTVISLTLGTNTYAGCSILYTVEASNATDYQAKTGLVHVAAVRAGLGGTTQILDAVTTAAVTTGTLASTWAATYSGGVVDVTLNANSSLTPTTLRVRYVVFNNGSNLFT